MYGLAVLWKTDLHSQVLISVEVFQSSCHMMEPWAGLPVCLLPHFLIQSCGCGVCQCVFCVWRLLVPRVACLSSYPLAALGIFAQISMFPCQE